MAASNRLPYTVLCKSNANEIRQISFFVLANFRAQFRAKFRKIWGEKFHCQKIFQGKFQGNIARYRPIFQKDKRKIAISKISRSEILRSN